MKRVKVSSICDVVPQDDLWFVVTLDEQGYVVYPKNSDDLFGQGSINYSGDARRYAFKLYWSDEGIAGTDWQDRHDKACDLAILDLRLAVGETFKSVFFFIKLNDGFNIMSF